MNVTDPAIAKVDLDIVHSIASELRRRLNTADEFTSQDIERELDREVTQRIDIGEVPFRHSRELSNQVRSELLGYGPLQALLDDDDVEEIWINAPDAIFVARDGVSSATDLILTQESIRGLVERMLRESGRRVDLSAPFVDASLPDGSRLHVAIPDVTRAHWSVNIRKFTRSIVTLTDLVNRNSLTAQAAEFIRLCVLSRCNVIVSGATQAGKTTLLNALLSSARERERIVTVEETFELDVRARDVVGLQCRQPNLEGLGEIGLRRLIKEALRMRPDRLVVGEVREAESLDLLIALNSGLPGACSIHANSALDALRKLCTLPLLAGRNIDSSFVVPTVAACVDIVIHCELDRFGERRVREIVAPTGRILDGLIETQTIFDFADGALTWTGETPRREDKFFRSGLTPSLVLTSEHA